MGPVGCLAGCAIFVSFAACANTDREVPPIIETVRAESPTRIGGVDGPPEYLFGQIVGIAVGADDVVYVADAIGASVRAYDRSGRYLTTVGSEGDGPGEFRRLLGIDIDPAGDLVVRGAFRLSVFRSPAGSPVADSLIRTVAVEGRNPDRGVRGRAAGSTFYGPSFFWEGFQRRGYYYLAYDSVGTVTDTVFVPPFSDPETTGLANFAINEQGGRNVVGINRAPFEPRPSWDITAGGHVVFAAGDRYDIVEVNPQGDTVRTIRREVPSQPIPDGERADSAQAFAARLDSLPVPIDQVRGMSMMARRGELPETLPQVVSVQVDGDGNIWVRRWPGEGVTETVFDVFGVDDDSVRQVTVPAVLKVTPAPWFTDNLVAGVLTDPATGVESVGVFRLPQ